MTNTYFSQLRNLGTVIDRVVTVGAPLERLEQSGLTIQALTNALQTTQGRGRSVTIPNTGGRSRTGARGAQATAHDMTGLGAQTAVRGRAGSRPSSSRSKAQKIRQAKRLLESQGAQVITPDQGTQNT